MACYLTGMEEMVWNNNRVELNEIYIQKYKRGFLFLMLFWIAGEEAKLLKVYR